MERSDPRRHLGVRLNCEQWKRHEAFAGVARNKWPRTRKRTHPKGPRAQADPLELAKALAELEGAGLAPNAALGGEA